MGEERTTATENKQCTWCGRAGQTKDHVFPRLLGGTKDLKVPACHQCQTMLSKVEAEVGRRSEFALYIAESGGPRGRHPKRPSSGQIQFHSFRKKDDTLGGYIELAFKVGDKHPITLPSLELDPRTLRCRKRGASPQEFGRLVEKLVNISRLPIQGDSVVPFHAESDSVIRQAPDFWPRVFLDFEDGLHIAARDEGEGSWTLRVIIQLCQDEAFVKKLRNYDNWCSYRVPASDPHRAVLMWDPRCVERVIAKIIYALAVLQAPATFLQSERLIRLRSFVIGEGSQGSESMVREVCPPHTVTEFKDRHVALIQAVGGRFQAQVVLYGALHVIDLGEDNGTLAPQGLVVAEAVFTGTRPSRLLPQKEAVAARDILRRYLLEDAANTCL